MFLGTLVAESSSSAECPKDRRKNRRCSLGRGSNAQTKEDDVVATRMAPAGVFRLLGSTEPTGVWWLAFTGDGSTEPGSS